MHSAELAQDDNCWSGNNTWLQQVFRKRQVDVGDLTNGYVVFHLPQRLSGVDHFI